MALNLLITVCASYCLFHSALGNSSTKAMCCILKWLCVIGLLVLKSNMNLSSFCSLLTNLDNIDYCFNLRKFSGVVGEVGTNDFIPFLFLFQESMFGFLPTPKRIIPGKNFLLLDL